MLDTVPQLLIGLVVAALMILADELGFRARRLVEPRKSGTVDEAEGTLVAGALALLSLLFTFTFAAAQERYDQRRQLVMDEANAVTTSYLLYQSLEAPERDRLGALMREYTDLRSRGFDPQVERARLDALVERTAALQARIWESALKGSARRPELAESMVDSTRRMFEIAATRRAVVEARLPAFVRVTMLTSALICAFAVGYGLAVRRRHRLLGAAVYVLFALFYVLILDLGRSYSGPIRVSQAPMVWAAETIAASEARRRGGAAAQP